MVHLVPRHNYTINHIKIELAILHKKWNAACCGALDTWATDTGFTFSARALSTKTLARPLNPAMGQIG